jgi:eukaryotic-like serine/threonine-protein kinase
MSARVILTISSGSLRGKEFIYDSPRNITIGRDPTCEICFPDNADHDRISRYHCKLEIVPPQIKIYDETSVHGTSVNRVPVGGRTDAKQIDRNALIIVGGVEIKVVIEGIPIPIPPDEKQLSALEKIIKPILRKGWQALCNFLEIGEPASTAIVTEQPQPPTIPEIEGYKLLELLGEGIDGQVYLVENTKGEQVALKMMTPALAADPSAKLRFKREIENTKVLKHPNVIKFLDDDFYANSLFYTMEYCSQGNLATWMDKTGGKFRLEMAKPIMFDILSGLEYLHEVEVPYVRLQNGGFGQGKGLVHRDLKPANIFLVQTEDGLTAKIGDFGLSKAYELAAVSLGTVRGDAPRGTPNFMPRQQLNNFQFVQPEVDIWSAAACFYYMLTYYYPRDLGEDVPLASILERPVIPIRDRSPQIPPPLAEVIDRALAEDSQNQLHYKQVKDFRIDLEQALSS